MSSEGITVAGWHLGGILGQGAYGKVYLANKDGDEQNYAIKEIEKAKIERKNMTVAVEREIEVMKGMKQKNIVQLLDVAESDTHLYMVLELAEGGELFDKIVNSETGTFDEDTARFYFRQLVDGVEYCHKQGVAHRDLKLENLLLDARGVLKITDFGFSTYFTQSEGTNDKQKSKMLNSLVGTLCYLAPEVLMGDGYNGRKADIWSMGVILYVMLCGQYPFNAASHMMKIKQIKEADFTCPDWLSADAQMLISRMMEPSTEERITIPEIRKDPWFNMAIDHVQDLDIDVTQLQVEYFADDLDNNFDDTDDEDDDDTDDYYDEDDINDEIDEELSEDIFGASHLKVANLDEVREAALAKYGSTASQASQMSQMSQATVVHNEAAGGGDGDDNDTEEEEEEEQEQEVEVDTAVVFDLATSDAGDEEPVTRSGLGSSKSEDSPLTKVLVSPKVRKLKNKGKSKSSTVHSGGLDLSALDRALDTDAEDDSLPEFQDKMKRRTRFASRYTATTILDKLEEVFADMDIETKVNAGQWGMDGTLPEQGGTFKVQIFRMGTGLRMVEFQRGVIDILSFQQFYKATLSKLFGDGLGAYQSVGDLRDVQRRAGLQVGRQVSWS